MRRRATFIEIERMINAAKARIALDPCGDYNQGLIDGLRWALDPEMAYVPINLEPAKEPVECDKLPFTRSVLPAWVPQLEEDESLPWTVKTLPKEATFDELTEHLSNSRRRDGRIELWVDAQPSHAESKAVAWGTAGDIVWALVPATSSFAVYCQERFQAVSMHYRFDVMLSKASSHAKITEVTPGWLVYQDDLVWIGLWFEFYECFEGKDDEDL